MSLVIGHFMDKAFANKTLRLNYTIASIFLLIFSFFTAPCLQADPIKKALKAIRNNQKEVALQKLLLRQLTKDSSNPVFWHAIALCLDNEVSKPTAYETYLYSVRCWGVVKDPTRIKKIEKKYKITALNTDSLLQIATLDWIAHQPNFDLSSARSLLKILEENTSLLVEFQKLIIGPIENWSSVSVKTHLKLLDVQEEYIDKLEFDSILNSRNITALKNRRDQLANLPTYAITEKTKALLKMAQDTLMQWEFEEMQAEETLEAFAKFLKNYPNASEFQRTWIAQKSEAIRFNTAQQLNTVESYDNFLQQYPKSQFRERALLLKRALTVIPVPARKANGKFGFVDSANFQPWLEYEYKLAYPLHRFNNPNKIQENGATLIPGCALVMLEDTFGLIEFTYITKDGKPFTKNNYELIHQFSPTLAFVQRGGRWGILNAQGKELIPCKFENLRFDTAQKRGALQMGKTWALFNENGKLISAPKYSHFGFQNSENSPNESSPNLWFKGKCAAAVNGQWGLIDTAGNALTPFAYESMSTLPHGRFLGKINAGYCVWRDSANCTTEYSETVDFGKPYTLIQQNNLWGIIDTIGKVILPPIYEKALLVDATIALLKNKKWIFYYSKGEFTLPIKGNIDDFRLHGDGIVFAKQKKTWLMYHAGTRTIRKISTPKHKQLTDTLLFEYFGNNGFITHINGRPLIKDTLSNISPLNNHEWLATKSTGTGLLCIPSMEWSLPPLYQDVINSEYPNLYIVQKNNKWGVVNSFNNEIIPIQYDAISDGEFPGYWFALKGETTLWIDAAGREILYP